MEGPQLLDRCVVGLERCSDLMPCPQHDLYKPIRQRLKDYLNTTSVADLASSLKAKQAWREINDSNRGPQSVPVTKESVQ
jgi:DNA-binding IscR family transcriptional regulator